MKQALILFFVSVFCISANAQQKFWISFRDKANVSFDPYSYFERRTIDQRIAMNIPLNDSSDYPVNAEYILKISKVADSLSWSSRWLNGTAVFASVSQIETIIKFPFVKSVLLMDGENRICMNEKKFHPANNSDFSLLHYQLQRMQADTFVAHNIDGHGILIAVFDVGFPNVNTHPAFEHLRREHKIISTYDFVSKQENVFHGHWHGTATLSCIAGKADSINIGAATGAAFLLARTEKLLGETFSEEENWLAAAEWADRLGVNIISSSLGYTYHRYFNDQMDGRTSLVARAATLAASKGILVVNAAGNEGSNSWRGIVTPADADSVLTVGGTNPYTDMHIYYSSFGPSSTGKLKPNVCATGEAIVATASGFAEEEGTSFSAPLVAGFAACAWQSHRQWSNLELFDEIEKSSHLYPYFDYAHGFGIPQAQKILTPGLIAEPTFDFVIINNDIKVFLREQYSYAETEESLGYRVRRNFYYKIEDKDGQIKRYTVLLADRKEMLHFFAEDFNQGDVITVHFEGYTSSLDFPESK